VVSHRVRVASASNESGSGMTPVPLTSNTIQFQVITVTSEWQAEQLARAVSLLDNPVSSVEKQSLWRRTAKIDVNEPLKAGVRDRSQREDETWLALPRPDLLVATSSRDFQIEILGRIARGPSTRALPSSLPEWAQVDRKASFWGLRHYSDPEARHDNSNPRAKDSEAAQSDAKALGATVQFDMDNNIVEVRYLSGSGHLPRFIESMVEHEFQVDQPQADIWRLKSNLRNRGDFPFHFAAYLLGFGGYR